MFKSSRLFEIGAIALLVAGIAGSGLAQDAASPVTARMKVMATINSGANAVRNAAAANDMPFAKTAAASIDEAFKGFAANFPAGSQPPLDKTRAKAEVWSDAAGFKAQLDKAVAASDALVAATNGTDPAAVITAATALNAVCTSCHATYRAPAV